MVDKETKIKSKKQPQVNTTKEVFFGLSFVFNFGFVILIPALLGIFAGTKLDSHFGTKPWFTIIILTLSVIFGFTAGIYQVKTFIEKGKNL